MKLVITERQLKILNENSITEDLWEKDLGGEYIRRYRKNKKTNVKRVQKMLVIIGYDIGHYSDGEPLIDGIYGYKTANAIRQFQENSFDDRKQWDKIVGPITYTELWNQVDEIAGESNSTVDELIIHGLPDVQDTTTPDEEDDNEHEHDHEEDEYEESDDEQEMYGEDKWFAPISEEGSGWEIRHHDHFGSGEYGASRGNRKHKGLDIISNKGGKVFSPMDGKIKRTFHPYSNKCRFLMGVEIVGEGEYSDYKMKLMYVDLDDNVDIGDTVNKGDVVATQQDLLECYPPRNGKSMTNHIHFEVYENGKNINPEKIIVMKKPMMV